MAKKEILPIQLVEIEPKNYHLFVKVKIGRKNARLLLDTGASKTAFDIKKVFKYIPKDGLMANEIHSIGLGSNKVNTGICNLPNLKFGSLKMKKVEIAVLDLAHVNEAYQMLKFKPIDGVLGSDILFELKAEINYHKKTLALKR